MAAAVTIAFAGGSRNLLVYTLTATGAASGNLDAAGAATPDLLTDCGTTNSALRTFLATTYADQAAAQAAVFDGTTVAVDILPRDADAAWIVEANVLGGAGTALRLTLTAAALDATGSKLRIEYRHSEGR